MATTLQAEQAQLRKPSSPIPLLLILGLLTLRIPFLTGIATLVKPLPVWVDPAYQIATYLLTAVFMIWECDHLADYHIDSLAVWIIILFKPLETLILRLMTFGERSFPLAFPGIPSLIIWTTALALVIGLRLRHYSWQKIRWVNIRWLLIGALAGVGTAGLLSYPISLQINDPYCASYHPAVIDVTVQGIYQALYQVGYAAVDEEPLFRGILWGFLLQLGWKNVWIWLFQAALFTLSHLYYFNSLPVSFYLVVPTGALVLGLLAWRSRSIATSMAAHGFMNSLGYTLGCIAYGLRI